MKSTERELKDYNEKLRKYETINEEEFLELPIENIREIVRVAGPKVLVLVSDGSQRTAMILHNLMPESEDFEKRMFDIAQKYLMHQVKCAFDLGVEKLFLPALKHENLMRSRKYAEMTCNYGYSIVFKGDDWLNFYKEYDIRVRVYGDIDYISELGFGHIKEWAKYVENKTKNHNTYTLFWGLAISNYYEIPRIASMAIDFYLQNGKYPSRRDLIKEYYGEHVEEVEIYIRSTEIKDSDIQPPLISGRKTQMYFLATPAHISFNERNFRRIIYDFLFRRSRIFGKKTYTNKDLGPAHLERIKKYYEKNKDVIICTGEKVGKIWLPNIGNTTESIILNKHK